MLRVCLSMLVLVIVAGCGPPERSSLEDGPDQALLDTVFTAFGPMQVMGAGTALVSGDSVVLVAGLGSAGGDRPYTSATVQNIGSISKTFIGVAIMKAVELGLVDLDAPIQHHLPFPVHHPHFPEVPITLRHLATHTSGIRDTEAAYYHQTYVLRVAASDPSWNDWSPLHPVDPDDAVTMEQLLERALADHGEWRSDSSFTDHRPGTRFEYSNLGATLAAFVLQRAVGTSFEAFTQEHILEPLGMQDSYWQTGRWDDPARTQLFRAMHAPLPDYRLVTYPDGGFTTSSRDMARYLRELIRASQGRGTLLSATSYAELLRPQLDSTHFADRSMARFTDDHNMGIFLGMGRTGYFGHTGGDPGVTSMLFVDPEQGIGCYAVVNTELEDFGAFMQWWKLLWRKAGEAG